MKHGKQMYSKLYQEVIIVVGRGHYMLPGGSQDGPYLLDTNGRTFPAASFVDGLGDGNF